MENVVDTPDSPLRIESSLDLLLVLLYASGQTAQTGEPIEGITRLQKLIFLLQQGKGPASLVQQAMEYSFQAYKMGPYTRELDEDLSALTSLGFLRTERLDYYIADDGDVTTLDRETPTLRVRDPARKITSYRFRLTDDGRDVSEELWDTLSNRDQKELEEFKSFFNSLSLRQLLIFVYEKYPKFAEESEIKRKLGL